MKKWPDSLTLIRHGQSEANILEHRFGDEELKHFKEKFQQEFAKLDIVAITEKSFPSEELLEMAKKVLQMFAPKYSDFDTALSPRGKEQATLTGEKLAENIPKPSLIYVSPYHRTRQTLEGLMEGWPELEGVKVIEDERLREREHGKVAIYGMRELFFVFNPQYALLFKLGSEYDYRHDGGESLLDVKERVRSFMKTRIHRESSETDGPRNIMLVTHGLVKMATRAYLENWDREKYLTEQRNNSPYNCGVTVYKSVEPQQGRAYRDNIALDKYNMKLY